MDFKGAHFPKDVIMMAIRWYIAYPLSYRHVEEMLEAHGIKVDHATIRRWVIKYAPMLEEAFHPHKRTVDKSWRGCHKFCVNAFFRVPWLGICFQRGWQIG